MWSGVAEAAAGPPSAAAAMAAIGARTLSDVFIGVVLISVSMGGWWSVPAPRERGRKRRDARGVRLGQVGGPEDVLHRLQEGVRVEGVAEGGVGRHELRQQDAVRPDRVAALG